MIQRSFIIDKAAETLSVKPFATMEQIAAAAGISRITLYRDFTNLGGLHKAIAKTAINKADAVFSQVNITTSTDIADLYELTARLMPVAHYFDSNYVKLQIMGDKDLAKLYVEGDQILSDYFGRLQRVGTLRMDVKPEWIAETYSGLISSARSLLLRRAMSPKDAPDYVVSIILNGFTSQGNK